MTSNSLISVRKESTGVQGEYRECGNWQEGNKEKPPVLPTACKGRVGKTGGL